MLHQNSPRKCLPSGPQKQDVDLAVYVFLIDSPVEELHVDEGEDLRDELSHEEGRHMRCLQRGQQSVQR